MTNNNLPTVYKNTLPDKIKKGIVKTGKIIGSSAALLGSVVATGIGASIFPPLVIPTSALMLYSGNKLANNIYYTAYKDLAFVGRKSKNNVKIYQDVIRPDIFSELRGMDKREKLAFLQLQILVGLTKFDRVDKNGNPMTIETDSHGMIRKTFHKLNELGYIKNYEESFLKKSHLVLPKLAFGNTELGKNTDVYNMKFQMSEKQIDFDDPKFRTMFPMVFSKRGLLAKAGYTVERGENGELIIDYHKKQRREKAKEEKRNQTKEKNNITNVQTREEDEQAKFREELNSGISMEEQHAFVQKVLDSKEEEKTKDERII